MNNFIVSFLLILLTVGAGKSQLVLQKEGHFSTQGLDVTVFADIYPDGHQTGVTIIQHNQRVAANGDIRLEASPGQWSPVPKGGKQVVDQENSSVTQTMWYPDTSKNGVGFNPIDYPDLQLKYDVVVTALKGNAFEITVNLSEELPKEWLGKVGFHLELFPGHLFGKSWIMDDEVGVFPLQANGTASNGALPIMSKGKNLLVSPEEELQKVSIESKTGELRLIDGRTNHNNGWYIVREVIKAGTSSEAISWVVTPNVVKGWMSDPVVQVSQVGYHPDQSKKAVVELDPLDQIQEVSLIKIDKMKRSIIKQVQPEAWGDFLRYKYVVLDFSEIKEAGLYQVEYGTTKSEIFKIDPHVYDRGVWQPVLEYFLPVQMCHMRVNENYRVWHDHCHKDDAMMAPTDLNHFDGYEQGTETLTSFEPGEHVPGCNEGGWHDAGDYDLRVESQIGTIWNLALMIEEFGLNHDATNIDYENHVVEIHESDGENDATQQIEHGLASVLGGYRSLGRLYRGIICPDLRQYVMLGEASNMTDGLTATEGGLDEDNRMVFTEENPDRDLHVAAGLAVSARVLAKVNAKLASEALRTAQAIFSLHKDALAVEKDLTIAASELFKTTKDKQYSLVLKTNQDWICQNIHEVGWALSGSIELVKDKDFVTKVDKAVSLYHTTLKNEQKTDSPYDVPYKPHIWGAGWSIQRFGVEQYYLHKTWPHICDDQFFLNSLNFVLGCHPGSNNASFASGVGAKSVTTAYGVNRADWSFIPGGVVSGTALIRPNLPELKEWPYFWQQTEYVMGGGSTNFMFLALAAQHHFKNK